MSTSLYTTSTVKKSLASVAMLPRVSAVEASRQCSSVMDAPCELLVRFCNWKRLTFGLLCFMAQMKLIPRTVAEVSRFIGVSRKSLYSDRHYACYVFSLLQQILCFAFRCLHPSKDTIDKAILVLRMDGRCATESIQRILSQILPTAVHRSIGYISGVISRYSDIAKEINEETDYKNVSQVANDEIFDACGKPLLTGVDLESNVVYLMKLCDDRTGETWKAELDALKAQNLYPRVAISDAAGSILKSVREAYSSISVRLDTFHTIRSLGMAFYSLERSTYKAINDTYKAEKKLLRIKYRWSDEYKAARSKYVNLNKRLSDLIESHERIETLYRYITELLNHNGYTMEETLELMNWLLDELYDAGLKSHYEKLYEEAARMKERMPSVLAFLGDLPAALEGLAVQMAIPLEAMRLLYHRLSTVPGSDAYKALTKQIIAMVDSDRLREMEHARNCTLYNNKKASSFIENVNSRVRPYMNAMQELPKKSYPLLQFYLNNKKLRRSRVADRVGKSPMERLLNIDRPEFIGILQEHGYLLDA